MKNYDDFSSKWCKIVHFYWTFGLIYFVTCLWFVLQERGVEVCQKIFFTFNSSQIFIAHSSTSLLKIYTTALIPELLLPQFNWSPNKKWKKYPNILLWKNHILQKWGQRGKFLQLRETHSAMHRYCCRTWWQSFTNAFLGNLTRVRGTPLWNAVVTEVEGGLILHLK